MRKGEARDKKRIKRDKRWGKSSDKAQLLESPAKLGDKSLPRKQKTGDRG